MIVKPSELAPISVLEFAEMAAGAGGMCARGGHMQMGCTNQKSFKLGFETSFLPRGNIHFKFPKDQRQEMPNVPVAVHKDHSNSKVSI